MCETIERAREAGSVPGAERPGATGLRAALADRGLDLARRERSADRFGGELAAVRAQRERALLEAAGREGDVRRDADVPCQDFLGDPVVGGVGR